MLFLSNEPSSALSWNRLGILPFFNALLLAYLLHVENVLAG
jgi:hypothetical protein